MTTRFQNLQALLNEQESRTTTFVNEVVRLQMAMPNALAAELGCSPEAIQWAEQKPASEDQIQAGKAGVLVPGGVQCFLHISFPSMRWVEMPIMIRPRGEAFTIQTGEDRTEVNVPEDLKTWAKATAAALETFVLLGMGTEAKIAAAISGHPNKAVPPFTHGTARRRSF